MSITTRLATELDSEWILSELRAFSRFYGTRKPLFGDPEHAASVLSNLIHEHLVLVAEHKAVGLMGFIAGYLTPHPYNPALSVLHEAFWWVAEDHRGTRAGSKLLDEFIAYGKAKGVDWINFTLEHASPVHARSLLSRGFKPIERQYLMEVS